MPSKLPHRRREIMTDFISSIAGQEHHGLAGWRAQAVPRTRSHARRGQEPGRLPPNWARRNRDGEQGIVPPFVVGLLLRSAERRRPTPCDGRQAVDPGGTASQP
jgi:hypothetical protein